ncbi:MAG: hypothetical protein HY778_06650 [Betaproteobacteria bacterium]|nr:hypothetical protein [Betaproteobacteria bacterium]
MPIIDWLHYADHRLAPICRSSSGSYMPVADNRATIVEWAWSPQYAKRFGVAVQPDGLKDGPLWLVGITVLRLQAGERQTYHCRIAGLIDNRLPIIWPPGEQHMIHPGYQWSGGLPGNWVEAHDYGKPLTGKEYVPGQATWYKNPNSDRQAKLPEDGIGTPYLSYYKDYLPGLAYFELQGGCAYFNDPESFRNQIRFPATRESRAAFKSNALAFDLPDGLMRKIYPYTREADAWGGCLLHRIDGKRSPLPLWATRRFKGLCEPEGAPHPSR